MLLDTKSSSPSRLLLCLDHRNLLTVSVFLPNKPFPIFRLANILVLIQIAVQFGVASVADVLVYILFIIFFFFNF